MIGYCACYAMVCVFYLAAFYTAMLKRAIVIRGIDPLQYLRKQLDWLQTRWYLNIYVGACVHPVALCVV